MEAVRFSGRPALGQVCAFELSTGNTVVRVLRFWLCSSIGESEVYRWILETMVSVIRGLLAGNREEAELGRSAQLWSQVHKSFGLQSRPMVLALPPTPPRVSGLCVQETKF